MELSEDVVESSSSRAPKFASKSALSGSMDSMDFIHFKCMVMDGHGWSWMVMVFLQDLAGKAAYIFQFSIVFIAYIHVRLLLCCFASVLRALELR